MSRRYRIVVEGMPLHVIQRGNRRQRVFFSEDDRMYYMKKLKANCDRYKVKIWAYCLMDNHIHLVLVPDDRDIFYKSVAETHQAYTLRINKRNKWRGYLWQGRFISFVMQELYLLQTVRYVERNPVRAGIIRNAVDYRWSSAAAHVLGKPDKFLSDGIPLPSGPDWLDYLSEEDTKESLELIRKCISRGRVLGNDEFLARLSLQLGISLLPKNPGPVRGRKI